MDRVDATRDKPSLRTHLVQQRLSLSQETFQTNNQAICDRLQQSTCYQEAQTILAYFSIRQEPDLCKLWIDSSHPKSWSFPRCVGKQLVFHQCDPTDMTHFQTGTYGIQEPLATLPTVQPEMVDLILVPAVACDRAGYRLGYGAGYYDRLLAKPEWAKIPAIGIVFDFALLVEIPRNTWDCPLTGVCTEQELTIFLQN